MIILFSGLTNLYVMVGNSSFKMSSPADKPGSDNFCNFYKGPPAKDEKVSFIFIIQGRLLYKSIWFDWKCTRLADTWQFWVWTSRQQFLISGLIGLDFERQVTKEQLDIYLSQEVDRSMAHFLQCLFIVILNYAFANQKWEEWYLFFFCSSLFKSIASLRLEDKLSPWSKILQVKRPNSASMKLDSYWTVSKIRCGK